MLKSIIMLVDDGRVSLLVPGRGTRARHRMYGESIPTALLQLVARNRRRYGGYVVHLGMVIYFAAFAGYAFKTEMEATLRPGDSATLKSPFGHTYTFPHLGVSQFEQLNRVVTQASVQVTKDGAPAGVINSEKRQHFSEPAPGVRQKSFEPSTEVGIRSTLQEDLYIVYAGSVEGTEEAVYRFTINPLVLWVWIGGAVRSAAAQEQRRTGFSPKFDMWPPNGR